MQKTHIKLLQEHHVDIYVNTEMALEDKEIGYELELTRQIVLSVSDITQVLTIRRYYTNNLGDKLTLGKKLLPSSCQMFQNSCAWLKICKLKSFESHFFVFYLVLYIYIYAVEPLLSDSLGRVTIRSDNRKVE